MVGILVSFWDGPFSGAMLVSGSVYIYIYHTHICSLGFSICRPACSLYHGQEIWSVQLTSVPTSVPMNQRFENHEKKNKHTPNLCNSEVKPLGSSFFEKKGKVRLFWSSKHHFWVGLCLISGDMYLGIWRPPRFHHPPLPCGFRQINDPHVCIWIFLFSYLLYNDYEWESRKSTAYLHVCIDTYDMYTYGWLRYN